MGSGPPYPVSSRRPGCVPLARHNRVRRRSAETCPSPFSRQPRSSDLFRRSSTSRCDQYPILAGRAGGSDGNSLSAASARWRSRRNSFMRARIIPKSSAARGWIIGSSRSPDLVLTAARSRLRADCKAQRSSVNFPRQVLPPGLSGTAFLAIPGSRTTITPRSPRSLSVRLQTFRYRGTDGSNPVPSSGESLQTCGSSRVFEIANAWSTASLAPWPPPGITPLTLIHHVGIIPWSAAAIPREDDLLVVWIPTTATRTRQQSCCETTRWQILH